MKKNRIYHIEELIEDSGFVDHVMGRASADEENRWRRYLLDYPDQANTIDDARLFIQQFDGKDELVDDAVLMEVRENLKSMVRAGQQKPRTSRRMFMYAAAACFAFLLASVFLFNNDTTTILANVHEQKSHTLVDGSVVKLNAQSNLSYDASSYDKEKRQLQLQGQAFFEVEKGKPFIVQTAIGQVEVLGTSFDIFDRQGLFIVGCRSGKVRVSAGEDVIVLLPGEEMRMVDEKMVKSKVNIDEIGAWRDGMFYYEDVKLRRILNEVGRQFAVTIDCEPHDLGEQMYTGYFTNKSLDSALTSICWPMRLDFEHKKNTIVVSKK